MIIYMCTYYVTLRSTHIFLSNNLISCFLYISFAFQFSVLLYLFGYCKWQSKAYILFYMIMQHTKPNQTHKLLRSWRENMQFTKKVGITLVMVSFLVHKSNIWYICDTHGDKHGKDWIFKKVSQICRHSHFSSSSSSSLVICKVVVVCVLCIV